MINTETRNKSNAKKEFSILNSDMFSLKVVKVRPIFLLLLLIGLMTIFYLGVLNPDLIFSVVTGLALFAAGFVISNVFFLNASGKREDLINRMIVHSSTDLFLIFKIKDGRFKYASPGLENLLGFEMSTVINQYDLSFVHPSDRFDFYNILDKNFLRLNRSFTSTLRMIKRDGSIRWIKIKGDVIVDASNQMENVILNMRDVTEAKEIQIAQEQYQKSLEQSLEKLRKEKQPTQLKAVRLDPSDEKTMEEKSVLKRKFQPALTFRKLKLKI